MTEPYIPDYKTRLRDELLSYFTDNDLVDALVDAVGSVMQDYEDALFDLRSTARLDYATGEHLDQWGSLVAEGRGALTDNEYRRVILARLVANRSNGLGDEATRITDALFNSVWRKVRPLPPAAYQIEFATELALDGDFQRRASDVLKASRPAGVEQTVVQVPQLNPLRLDGPTLDGPLLSRRII